MEISQHKVKRKDGKWRNKINLMDLAKKAKNFKDPKQSGNFNLFIFP